ncbi:MAG TPA: hypothetical protein VIL48_05480 [Acidimicrobiales bacterium]
MKLAPVLAASGTTVPDDASWAYEPKWDGLRTLVRIGPDLGVRLATRQGWGVTRSFPELAGMGHVLGRSMVLDSETIVMDVDRRPSYERLAARLRPLPGLPTDEREILRRFVDRHGVREGGIVRVAPVAQVHVTYAERSPRGLVRQAAAERLRAARPGTS